MESQIDYKYLDGKIYKLICKKDNLIYIGSTIKTLNSRLSSHKNKTNPCVSKKIINNGDYEIILLELYPCMCKRELEKREQLWIDNMDCINFQRSYLSKEERKDYLKNHKIEYLKNNKEKIYKANRQWSSINKDELYKRRNEKFECECGGKYTKRNKSSHCKSKKHIDYISKNNI